MTGAHQNWGFNRLNGRMTGKVSTVQAKLVNSSSVFGNYGDFDNLNSNEHSAPILNTDDIRGLTIPTALLMLGNPQTNLAWSYPEFLTSKISQLAPGGIDVLGHVLTLTTLPWGIIKTDTIDGLSVATQLTLLGTLITNVAIPFMSTMNQNVTQTSDCSFGQLTLGTGVKFPTTGGVPRLLDFYESFTWTTTMQSQVWTPDGITKGTQNVTIRFTRIGVMVTASVGPCNANATPLATADTITGTAIFPGRFLPKVNTNFYTKARVDGVYVAATGLLPVGITPLTFYGGVGLQNFTGTPGTLQGTNAFDFTYNCSAF